MIFQKTSALNKIAKLKKRLKVIQGGSSAGKTIAILLILIDQAQSVGGLTISVVSETLPHLRRGAIRDFLNIMEGHAYFNDALWNKSEFTYNFETGSKIEFFSADQPSKVRGPRRNKLFMNECNNIPFETYTQLAIRTDGEIYLDYNPVSEFWVHTDVIPKQDHDFLILTYKDNEGLSKNIVDEIESRRDRKGWWSVYGLGLVGEIEGKIYNNWNIIDEIPHEARLERYGLDFGYTNDPTAICALYYYNGGYIIDEITFQKGLSNKQIADILMNQPKALCVADSAEPKSIDEIKSFGVNIQPTLKGKDSVRQGIQVVQDQQINITKRSVNGIKAYRNYLWKVDKNGKILNEPDHLFSDFMDSVRYAMTS
jgi:phage terminase large subunit